MAEVIIPFESKKLLYRDEFTVTTTPQGCGSLEPCNMHQRSGRCTCLRIGNHAMWIYGCGATWTSSNIYVRDLVKEVIQQEEFDIISFHLDSIDYGSLLEAGFAAVAFKYGARLKILVNGVEIRRYDLTVDINNDRMRSIRVDLDLGPDDYIQIVVEEGCRAAFGYILLHVHDITLNYSGKASVPEEEVDKGDLEIDVVDTDDNPISGAEVKIAMGDILKRGVTGPQGVVVFQNIPYGKYDVIVSKSGYKRVSVQLTLDRAYRAYKITLEKIPGGFPMEEVAKYIAIAAAIAGGIGTVGYVLSTEKGREYAKRAARYAGEKAKVAAGYAKEKAGGIVKRVRERVGRK